MEMTDERLTEIGERYGRVFKADWKVVSQHNSADARTEHYVRFASGYTAFMREQEAEYEEHRLSRQASGRGFQAG